MNDILIPTSFQLKMLVKMKINIDIKIKDIEHTLQQLKPQMKNSNTWNQLRSNSCKAMQKSGLKQAQELNEPKI